MKYILRVALVGFAVLWMVPAHAQRKGAADYFLNPQVGLWFGPVTPVYTTADDVDTNLGGGLFFRYNTPYRPLKIGLDGSYQWYSSRGVNSLTLWPVYGSVLYRLPIKFALTFQVKAGAGGCYVKVKPDDVRQWDPMGMVGFETSFPAGKYVNIGLRLEYQYIYEGYIQGARRNGHSVVTGITLYFNVGGK